jgi:hypothetical protein
MWGTIANLILQFLSGATGGNLAGAAKASTQHLLKTTIARSAVSADRYGMFAPLLANTAASPDAAAAIGQVVTGGVAGAVLEIFGTTQKLRTGRKSG